MDAWIGLIGALLGSAVSGTLAYLTARRGLEAQDRQRRADVLTDLVGQLLRAGDALITARNRPRGRIVKRQPPAIWESLPEDLEQHVDRVFHLAQVISLRAPDDVVKAAQDYSRAMEDYAIGFEPGIGLRQRFEPMRTRKALLTAARRYTANLG